MNFFLHTCFTSIAVDIISKIIFSELVSKNKSNTYVRLSHRSPSYSLGQSQVSGAVQTPPFRHDSVHTAVE